MEKGDWEFYRILSFKFLEVSISTAICMRIMSNMIFVSSQQ